MDSGQEKFKIISRGRIIEVPLDDIRYIESIDHNCVLHTENGLVETGASMTLKMLEAFLPSPQFARCHNSFIVNLSHVASVGKSFTLKSGEEVLISRIGHSKWRDQAYKYNGWSLDEASSKRKPPKPRTDSTDGPV